MTPEEAQSIGLALQALDKLKAGTSSVELIRNAKEKYAWDIKAYSNDIREAKQNVEEINEAWVKKYGSVPL